MGSFMFCWCGVPCIQCTGSIINAGIKEIHCLKGTQDYQPEARWLYETSKTVLIEHDQSTIEDGVEDVMLGPFTNSFSEETVVSKIQAKTG